MLLKLAAAAIAGGPITILAALGGPRSRRITTVDEALRDANVSLFHPKADFLTVCAG